MSLESNPILNSPYHEPDLYYATDDSGALNYDDIRNGRPYREEDYPDTTRGNEGVVKVLVLNDETGCDQGFILAQQEAISSTLLRTISQPIS